MKKPIIFVIDDDQQVLSAVVRDLKEEYRDNYRILSTGSPQEAIESLEELKKKNETVALFLSDQKMPDMLGVDFLEEAKKYYPEAKRVLLTAYSDTDAAIRAINEVQLDYYLMKPWDPPEEKLYPILNELLEDWHNHHQVEFEGIKIIGYQWSPRSHAIKDFLSGNMLPFKWIDIEKSKKAKEAMKLHEIEEKDLPAVFFEDGSLLKNPTLQEVGDKTGMKSSATKKIYDVAIVGAGPAGLAAAVYGGSEGLSTIMIEKRAPGGQAGTSSKIENYLGFPNGVSGSELSRRAIAQAIRFGVEFLNPQEVVDIKIKGSYKILTLSNEEKINAKSVVITTGVEYKKLDAENINDYTGAGVYYGAAKTEAHACKNKNIYIVGAGNSAGQAAMYMAGYAKNVIIINREKDLSVDMSEYLIEQINATENIKVRSKTVIIGTKGKENLEKLVLKNIDDESTEEVETNALLIFIGSKPITDWLSEKILKDKKGFIMTGNSLAQHSDFNKFWKLNREPYLLETCSPGIFAAGDVRSGSVSRVASAVGEGAMAIKYVHEYLEEN